MDRTKAPTTRIWTNLAIVTMSVALVSCQPAAPLATTLPLETAAPIVPTATATAIPSGTPTNTPTPTITPSPTPTNTPTPTATPTETPTPTSTPIPRPVATLNPAGQVGLGVYRDSVPSDDCASVSQVEALVRHKMEYVLWFHAWGDSDRAFPSRHVWLAAQMGLTPVLTWEPWQRNFDDPTAFQPNYSLQSIAAGDHDAYIRSWAQGAKAAGVPIVIRFAHEQSTEPGVRSWYPWQGDPEGYRAAFRHIVSVFREEGASNVKFLWSAMWLNGWASDYYPGGDVVDFVGTTVLNHGTGATAEWAQWRTFYELFVGQYQAALQWNKPIIITEVATAEQGGDKAAWIRECFGSLKTDYPLVHGVLLLEVKSDREWPAINWSVASSAESLAAFREVISDPYFR
ncbi:MAG: glycoside hydrolase family 26 protein [Anaerolineae bacterium]